MSGPVERIRELVHRRGLGPTVRLAAQRLSPWTSWADEYVWYALDLGDPERPQRALEATFELRRGSREDMGLLEQLPVDPSVTSMSAAVVGERLAAGAVLWLVVEDGRTAFSCWTFRDRAPLSGARGNAVELPPGVALLEDSISSPDFRGRGVAPAAWSGVAAALAAEGLDTMVTKVKEDNVPSRRAVEKAGFRDVARMHRSGPAYRLRIRTVTSDSRHGWLSGIAR